MPLSCDCFPGCWRGHSAHWPIIEDRVKEKYKCAFEALPYGTYVLVGDTLRVETQAQIDKLEAAFPSSEQKPGDTNAGE